MNLYLLNSDEILETYLKIPSNIFIDNFIGPWIILFGFFLFLTSFFFKKNKYSIFVVSNLIILFGQYVYFSHFIDESYVAPRMSYVFATSGFLSFFEHSISQATVELLQTLISGLLFTQVDKIILSYYVVHLLIYLTSYIFIFKILKKNILNKSNLDLLILLLILQLPISYIVSASSGLGMNLLALLVVVSFYYFREQKVHTSLAFSAFFPLIRPDGILYSLIFLIYYSINKRIIFYKYLILTILSFLSYVLISYYFYEEWPAPPMAFKSHDLALLLSPDFYDGKFKSMIFFFKQHFVYGFIILVGTYYQLKKYKFKIIDYFKKDIEGSTLLVLNFLFFGIFVMYLILSVNIHGNFRYSMIFSLFLPIISSLIYSNIVNKKSNLTFIILILLFFQVALNKGGYLYPTSKYIEATKSIVNSYAKAALELKKIDFADNVIASVEMASFPLYLEKDVLDLYGYSNSLITNSKQCNSSYIKINPLYIKNTSPDFIFHESLDKEYYNMINKVYPSKYKIDNDRSDDIFELKYFLTNNLDKWLLESYFSKKENYYGDMNFIINTYDFFLLENSEIYTVLLIKKNKIEHFMKEFKNIGYHLLSTFNFDDVKFLNEYNEVENSKFNC
jgi:hypothetical protein